MKNQPKIGTQHSYNNLGRSIGMDVPPVSAPSDTSGVSRAQMIDAARMYLKQARWYNDSSEKIEAIADFALAQLQAAQARIAAADRMLEQFDRPCECVHHSYPTVEFIQCERCAAKVAHAAAKGGGL